LLVAETAAEDAGQHELEQLLTKPVEKGPLEHKERIAGAIVGTLVGFRGPYEPLVIYPDQPESTALNARASVDLQAEHIGHEVILVFEKGNPMKPIVTGLIRVSSPWPAKQRPPQVDVDVDGQRLILTAKEQLVLSCGDASLTLHCDGKVVIRGRHVVSHASGVNRIRGGSVELN